jgi:CRISPR/Cas system-associated exonuclease Cas4 (RecB family)
VKKDGRRLADQPVPDLLASKPSVSGGMPIVASTLYDFVQCPTRVALDKFGDASKRDPINPFVRLLWDRGTLFERETIAKVDQPFTDVSEFKEEEKEQLTLEAMRRGDGLIYGGRISADDLIGIPDLLRKESGGYIPGDIKSGAGEEGGGKDGNGKPKLNYAVQLALYIDILERLGLSADRRAFVWDINGEEVAYHFSIPLGPTNPQTLWDEYEKDLTECRGMLAARVTPLAAYTSVCKFCHWYTFCVEQLTAADDLTLIPRLGRSVRDVMRSTVPTVAALAAANPDTFMKGKKRSSLAWGGIGFSVSMNALSCSRSLTQNLICVRPLDFLLFQSRSSSTSRSTLFAASATCMAHLRGTMAATKSKSTSTFSSKTKVIKQNATHSHRPTLTFRARVGPRFTSFRNMSEPSTEIFRLSIPTFAALRPSSDCSTRLTPLTFMATW